MATESGNMNEFKSTDQVQTEQAIADAGNDKALAEQVVAAQAENAAAAAAEAGDAIATDTPAPVDQVAPVDTDVEKVVEPTLSPRQRALEEIAGKGAKGRTQADDAAAIETDTAAAETAAAVDGTEGAKTETADTAQAPEYVIRKNEQGVDCLVVKSDGVEVLRPMRDIVPIVSKDTNADAKLEKASVTLKHIQKLSREIDQREASLTSRIQKLQETAQNSTASLPSTEDAGKVQEAAKSLVEAIYAEDTDGATKIIENLFTGRGAAATQDRAAMQSAVQELIDEQAQIGTARQAHQRIQEEVQEQVQQDWQAARTAFMVEYPDIKPGTEAWKTASAICVKLQAEPEFADATYQQIFREAGKRVRQAAKELASSTTQDRTAAKIASVAHVASRSSATQTTRASEVPQRKTQSQLVAEMRNTRRPHRAY